MTDICSDHCPFLGCASCEFAGGELPSAATVLPSAAPVDNYTGGVGSNAHTWGNPQRQLGVPHAS